MNASPLSRLLRERPVFVTGAGSISAAGPSVADLWTAAATGTATATLREFEFGQRQHSVAVHPVRLPTELDSHPQPFRKLDRVAQIAWLAASGAWSQARLELGASGWRVGVMVGSSRGPVGKSVEAIARVDTPRYPPSLSANCTFAVLSGVLAQLFRISGPSATISATCASAGVAIGLAAEQVVLGKADIMLVGGAEAALVPSVVAQLEAAGVLGSHEDPRRTCRPFDETRNGLSLGEGAAFLVLESAETAARRGVKPLAQLSGWGACVDDSGRAGVSAAGAGLIDAARQALKVAGLTPDAMDYINAHGSGTRLNDAAEARAVHELLGERGASVPCTSTKPITGHCLGATPALEAVICIQALRHQMIPPTANCLQPDPDCPINMLPNEARPAELRHVMSNSLGFWGHHASLIFSVAAEPA